MFFRTQLPQYIVEQSNRKSIFVEWMILTKVKFSVSRQAFQVASARAIRNRRTGIIRNPQSKRRKQ